MARLRASAALLVVVLLSTAVVIVSGDWFAECPRECMCKWISGKKAAICAGLLLDDIPRMSSDIQHLNLTDNNIQALGERAVAAAGVPHVQKLYLSRCKIRELDKSAFAELGNMIELDLSYNQIPSLHPATFKGLNRLRKLVLRGNPLGKLVAYQFPPLRHLTSLDLGECRLTQVDPVAFVHLKTVEVISLRGNRFERLRREPFLPLKNLKSLELFDNPWRCDCLLKDLREWLLDTKLYAAPTSCSQPERLHGRTWDTIGKEDFACKPSIEIPDDVVVGSRGDNVTLSCKFAADPPASTKWVLDGRILTNMSQIPFGDQLYVITEGTDYDDSFSIVGAAKWLNLTITNINEQDAGSYKCVGVNPGGLAERNVTLRFSSVEPAASPVKLALSPLVIAGISVAALVVFLTVVFLSITCFYRRKKNAGSRSGDTTKKQNGALVVSHHSTGSSIVGISPMRPAPLTSRNGGSVSYEKVPEAETRLNSTGDHDEKSFEDDLLGTESEEFAFLRNDGASGSRSSGSGAGGVRSLQTTSNNVYGGGESSSRSTRTPETASLHSDHPPNYFGGGVHNNSHHHYQHGGNYPDLLDVHQGRKYSAPASSNNYADWPSTGSTSAVAPMGYVTLPRRPRASWSHPVAPVVPPSPAPSLPPFLPGDAELMSPGKFRADPVYDNLGPRTTADGTLRRSSNGSAQSAVAAYFKQQMMQQPQHHQPDYYPADYPAPSSMADYGPSVDYGASRRAFQYSTLPRSTPNVSEAQYSHHHGGFRLPPVREESLGAADVRQRPSVQSLRRDRRPGQHPLSPERPSSTATDVSLPPPAPVANNNNNNINGPLNDDSDDADLELPPPPESLMADPKPAVNKKVPPKPPPKPTLKNYSVSKDSSRNSSGVFQDEGDDGTEI